MKKLVLLKTESMPEFLTGTWETTKAEVRRNGGWEPLRAAWLYVRWEFEPERKADFPTGGLACVGMLKDCTSCREFRYTYLDAYQMLLLDDGRELKLFRVERIDGSTYHVYDMRSRRQGAFRWEYRQVKS